MQRIHTNRKNIGSLNFVPLLILVALIYVFFTYDLESVMKNKRLNDNIAYLKSKVLGKVDQYDIDLKTKFLKTEGVSNTNKTDIFNLSNFFPQINSSSTQKSEIINTTSTNQTDSSTQSNILNTQNQRPKGYEDYGSLR